jgi:hypothetical protein
MTMDYFKSLERKMNSNKEYGFDETLAPINEMLPASDNILSFWIKKINDWALEEKGKNNEQETLLKSMKKYPNNSNIENYMLINKVLSNDDIDKIFDKLKQQSSEINEYLKNIIGSSRTGHYKRKRRILSLMILKSRNLQSSYFSKNIERKLYQSLKDYFFKDFIVGGIVVVNNSEKIKDIFIKFMDDYPQLVTLKYIKELLDGTSMYNIYKGNYIDSDNIEIISGNSQQQEQEQTIFSIKDYKVNINKNNLTKDDIRKKVFEWLNIDDVDDKSSTIKTNFAVTYIFSIFLPGECMEISELKDELGEDLYIPELQISKSFFSNINLDIFRENLGSKINNLINGKTRRGGGRNNNNDITNIKTKTKRIIH